MCRTAPFYASPPLERHLSTEPRFASRLAPRLAPRIAPRFVPSRLVSSSHLVSSRLSPSRLVASYRLVSIRSSLRISSHLVSSRLVASHLVSLRIVSFRLVSYRFVSYPALPRDAVWGLCWDNPPTHRVCVPDPSLIFPSKMDPPKAPQARAPKMTLVPPDSHHMVFTPRAHAGV